MTPLPKDLSTDSYKMLGEWALAAGRFFQSKQTGYVHLYYGESSGLAQTAPILENALFILALFRSRLVEQIQEAKSLLSALLAFYVPQKNRGGNFPVYVHEYPICRDPALGLQLLTPFYWMLKKFNTVLGTELKQQLEQKVHQIIEYSLSFHQINPFPYFLAVRLFAAEQAYGQLWNNLPWEQEGENKLRQLSDFQLEGWQNTRQLAHVLTGLQMIYSSLLQSSWSSLWKRIQETWHPHLACYIGPYRQEWQDGKEPQVNMYDLFGGFFAGQFSQRATLLNTHHLHGILIQPLSDAFVFQTSTSILKSILKEGRQEILWQVTSNPSASCTLLEKREPALTHCDKIYTPFQFFWGDSSRLHSFVCQGGNFSSCQYLQRDQSVILFFDLTAPLIEKEGKNPPREVEFFIDFQPNVVFMFEGVPTNTFEIGQTLQIFTQRCRGSIRFDLLQGKGSFLGHIMKGNRPSQVDKEGERRFIAYDWTLFLRTIRREAPCLVQAVIIFGNEENEQSSKGRTLINRGE